MKEWRKSSFHLGDEDVGTREGNLQMNFSAVSSSLERMKWYLKDVKSSWDRSFAGRQSELVRKAHPSIDGRPPFFLPFLMT